MGLFYIIHLQLNSTVSCQKSAPKFTKSTALAFSWFAIEVFKGGISSRGSKRKEYTSTLINTFGRIKMGITTSYPGEDKRIERHAISTTGNGAC